MTDPQNTPAGNDRADEATELAAEPSAETAGESHAAAETLAQAEARAADFRDQYLRAVAELENVRRRAERDVENAHRYGVERFARELLAVADSMEMGLDAARQSEGSQAIVEGFEATLRLLQTVFEKFGITRLDALGKPFDPDWHEAMTTQPSEDAAPDTVLAVVQTGYRIHDRPLRPARVIVARQP